MSKHAKKPVVRMLWEPESDKESDKRFLKSLSRKRMLDLLKWLDGYLKNRGWLVDEKGQTIWGTTGAPIMSLAGFSADREGHTIYKYFDNLYRMRNALLSASPAQITAIRYGYEAGLAHAESAAYLAMTEGKGAPAKKSSVDQMFASAVSEWKRMGRLTRPTFSEIESLCPAFWFNTKGQKMPRGEALRKSWGKWWAENGKK